MFQSRTSNYLGYDAVSGEHRYQITIMDDDFTESVKVSVPPGTANAIAAAIIKVYSRRNLNVPKNLWLLHEYCNREYVAQKHHH